MSQSPSTAPSASSQRQLEDLRARYELRLLPVAGEGQPLADVPPGVYGFSSSTAAPESPLYSSRLYQGFEFHKLPDGELQVVGYATGQEAATLVAGEEPIDFHLFPEPQGDAAALVTVRFERIQRAKAPSRSDGNYMVLHVGPAA